MKNSKSIVSELVKWAFGLLIFVGAADRVCAQHQEKIFYNSQWQACQQKDAEYYRLISFDAEGKPAGTVRDYYIWGNIQWEGKLLVFDRNNDNRNILDSICTWYYSNGFKTEAREYKEGKLTGNYTQWHENGLLKSKHFADFSEINWDEKGAKTSQTAVAKTVGDTVIFCKTEWDFDYEDNYEQDEDTMTRTLTRISYFYYDSQTREEVLHGLETAFYKDGSKNREEEYRNGVNDGAYIVYWRNGSVHQKGQYKQGAPCGIWTEYAANGAKVAEYAAGEDVHFGYQNEWYENGQPKLKASIIDGKKEGLQTTWYEDGTVESKLNFKNGLQHGKQQAWYENGKIQAEIDYAEGKFADGTYFAYEPDGNKDQQIDINGKTATLTTFHSNGAVETIRPLLFSEDADDFERSGLEKTFDENGNLVLELPFRDDEPHGLQIAWYPGGKKKSEVQVDDWTWNPQTWERIAARNGKETVWYENGKIMSETFYKEGEKDGSEILYYESGKKQAGCNYIADEKDGRETLYYDNGKLKQETNWQRDNKTGKETRYYISGKKHSELQYENNMQQGAITIYYENGKVMEEATVWNGVIEESTHRFFTSNGKPQNAGQASQIKALLEEIAPQVTEEEEDTED